MYRLALALIALIVFSGSADAQRARRRSARVTPPRLGRLAAAPKPPSALTPARNVILFVASGYTDVGWQALRAAQPSGFVALDRMPYTGFALVPPDSGRNETDLAVLLATGARPTGYTSVAWMQTAKWRGRSAAIVSSRPVDPMAGAFMLGTGASGGATVDRLRALNLDVLLPDMPIPPAFVNASAETGAAAGFGATFFQGLRAAARNPKGFSLVAAVRADDVPAADLNAALASAISYAAQDRGTLLVVASLQGEAPIRLHAFSRFGSKFTGTMDVTDVPKVIAGVAGIKPFRRDFSPLYQTRTAAAVRPTPAPANRAIVPTRPGPLPL